MRIASMILAIALTGVTLGSLLLSYQAYQEQINDATKGQKQAQAEFGREYEEKEQQLELEHQEDLREYEEAKAQAEANGELFLESMPLQPINWDSGPDEYFNEFDQAKEEAAADLKHSTIVHGGIILFIIIAEIGLLAVLPKQRRIK